MLPGPPRRHKDSGSPLLLSTLRQPCLMHHKNSGSVSTVTPLDNFQHLHSHPVVNEEFMQSTRFVRSENAIVTSMYNDAFAVPIVTLGHSLNRVKSKARRIVFYLPGRVSERALCIATASGFEPYAVERIAAPGDGVHGHFADQFTKLSIWKFHELGVKAVVYLDADILVRRNFDELFALPFNFAAVPDIYVGEPGFTIGFNAGVLFVRTSATVFHDLVSQINTAHYRHWEAEQAYLNVFYGPDVARLPYIYGGNQAIKKRNPELWEALQPELRLIHYSLVKPFWRGVYNETGVEDMHENVLRRAEDWGGLWRDEIMEWGDAWRETEETYGLALSRCAWKHGH
ncbi:nucleotide-diphospho-sugar transferase [Lentinus brumalis]|uniref:Nucleotide-diphospho-sugar transferase n=1 Tax=Lentinus brumalis TaxID=2498619 RepID=A0A371DMS9_9APHY|nr:nucleotide-diphospho-sugar transferase [Polyporus brumalis]